jgi:hypothetical protein
MNSSRVAVKWLTKSDISFFGQHVRESKQKGINLNSELFVDQFYPALQNRFEELHFPLGIIGPGAKPKYSLSRKVVRTPGAKNWRLNGEVVNDPPDDPGRYDVIAQDDYVMMAFEGVERPEAVTLVLVTAAQDADLHAAIARKFEFTGRHTMLAVIDSDVWELIEETQDAYPDIHPFDSLVAPDSPEEAVFGSAASQTHTAQGDGLGAAISQDALQRQLRVSEETGRRGEEVFGLWLNDNGHDEESYSCVCRDHARAAYDYQVMVPSWEDAPDGVFVDVKATKSTFDTPFHLSMAEIRWAATHANYRVARVYALATGTAQVTILAGIHEFAVKIVQDITPRLPRGAAIDGFEVEPEQFSVVGGQTPV